MIDAPYKRSKSDEESRRGLLPGLRYPDCPKSEVPKFYCVAGVLAHFVSNWSRGRP